LAEEKVSERERKEYEEAGGVAVRGREDVGEFRKERENIKNEGENSRREAQSCRALHISLSGPSEKEDLSRVGCRVREGGRSRV
jgi:hypothetical protein